MSDLEVGDHVIVALTPACGRCEFCAEEKPFLCTQMFATLGSCTMPDGTTRLSNDGGAVHQLCAVGGFAEHAVVPAGCAVRVDSDLPLETICLIGCGVTTGVGAALNTAGIRPGTTVAVLGCGGVGLSVVQGARIAGAKTDDHRADRARRRQRGAGRDGAGRRSSIGDHIWLDSRVLKDNRIGFESRRGGCS